MSLVMQLVMLVVTGALFGLGFWWIAGKLGRRAG